MVKKLVPAFQETALLDKFRQELALHPAKLLVNISQMSGRPVGPNTDIRWVMLGDDGTPHFSKLDTGELPLARKLLAKGLLVEALEFDIADNIYRATTLKPLDSVKFAQRENGAIVMIEDDKVITLGRNFAAVTRQINKSLEQGIATLGEETILIDATTAVPIRFTAPTSQDMK